MKKRVLSLILALLMCAALLPTAVADDRYLEINELSFPDDVFREWVIENLDVSGDADSGYYMTETQVRNVTVIDCSDNDIDSLLGIEFFTNLLELNCSFCFFTEDLYLGENTALTKLTCAQTALTTLDVSRNTALKELVCYNNYLSSLDLSHNPLLETLNCDENQLKTLDLSNNPAIENLYCSGNQLTSLNLSNNPALSYIDCEKNKLTSLDLSNCPSLGFLSCQNNRLKTLDVSSNPDLYALFCKDNQLAYLDLSGVVHESWTTIGYDP